MATLKAQSYNLIGYSLILICLIVTHCYDVIIPGGLTLVLSKVSASGSCDANCMISVGLVIRILACWVTSVSKQLMYT